jgi:hypothetical protein
MSEGTKVEVIVRRSVEKCKRNAETLHDIHDTLNFESRIFLLLELSIFLQVYEKTTFIRS